MKNSKKEECLVDYEIYRVDVLSVYESHKNDVLKDVVIFNWKLIGGNKYTLPTRIVDVHMNGRLSHCPMCKQGKVKLAEDVVSVLCNG